MHNQADMVCHHMCCWRIHKSLCGATQQPRSLAPHISCDHSSFWCHDYASATNCTCTPAWHQHQQQHLASRYTCIPVFDHGAHSAPTSTTFIAFGLSCFCSDCLGPDCCCCSCCCGFACGGSGGRSCFFWFGRMERGELDEEPEELEPKVTLLGVGCCCCCRSSSCCLTCCCCASAWCNWFLLCCSCCSCSGAD